MKRAAILIRNSEKIAIIETANFLIAKCCYLSIIIGVAFNAATFSRADENLLGYVKGAETLPEKAQEIYQITTLRSGKGQGLYRGWDSVTEYTYGASSRFSLSGEFKMQSILTEGLLIDGYLPQDLRSGLKPSGVGVVAKYNFLSPAKDDLGLSVAYGLDYSWLDPHSGQAKSALTSELSLLLQKYFLEGELIWVGNLVTESTHATRSEIAGLSADFEWPTTPEMEIEFSLGTGLSYRFLPSWYLGAETIYQTEFETEIGQERWSLFGGPSVHFGSEKWWATLTWFPQLKGGREKYQGQVDEKLHLIEKTEHEFRLKLGLNF